MCDTTLDWEYIPSPRNGQIITYMASDVKADITAIGKEDDKVKQKLCAFALDAGVKNKYIKTI